MENQKPRHQSFFVTVSSDLIQRLVPSMPTHWQEGGQPQLPTFAFTREERMLPAKLKIRGREKPIPGEVYKLLAVVEPRQRFRDAATGKECESRNMHVFRLYTCDNPPRTVNGELRFFTFPIESDALFYPAPIARWEFTGIAEQGCASIAAPGMEYRVRHELHYDTKLFDELVVVQLAGAEEENRPLPGAVKVRIVGGVDVYDHRRGPNRLSSFARAEHIRRTVGRRTFEFFNLRDADQKELEENLPEWVLTTDGLQPVE